MEQDCYDIGSSSGDSGGSIKWEWDCYNPVFAAEVDKPEPVTRTISSLGLLGPGRHAQVTYAVMSNAREATIHVKLRPKDGHSPGVHGKITARIGDFKEEIVLYGSIQQGSRQRFSPTDSRVLQLARSVIAVPCDWELHIQADLQIETLNNQGVEYLSVPLSFENGFTSSKSAQVNGNEIEVNVAWYPEIKITRRHPTSPRELPHISYTIGDDGDGFSRFIMELRWLLADHSRRKDILDDHPNPAAVVSSRNCHPVLARTENYYSLQTQKKAVLLRMQVAGDDVTSTTLLVHLGKACLLGFMNQNGDWYKFGKKNLRRLGNDLQGLDWYTEHNCTTILKSELLGELNSEKLGMSFAARAVLVLSRCQDAPDDQAKIALAGLSVIVCESARMNPLHDTFAVAWKDGVKLNKHMMDYIRNWVRISAALLEWKDHNYHEWAEDEELKGIGIKSPRDALDVIHLVRDAPIRGYKGRRLGLLA